MIPILLAVLFTAVVLSVNLFIAAAVMERTLLSLIRAVERAIASVLAPITADDNPRRPTVPSADMMRAPWDEWATMESSKADEPEGPGTI